MKKFIIILFLSVFSVGLLFCSGESNTGGNVVSSAEESAVKNVIVEAYIKGVFINRDTDAMKNGFHPEFSKADYHDDHMHQYSIDQWLEGIERLKTSNAQQPTGTITHKFLFVDVTGNAAAAKTEIYRDGKLIITDYISLFKLSDNWKIIYKIGYE